MTQRNSEARKAMLVDRRNRQQLRRTGQVFTPVPAAKRTPQGKMYANKSHLLHTATTCRHATKAGVRNCGCQHRKLEVLFEAKLAKARTMVGQDI